LTRHVESVLKNPALAFSISISAPHPLEYQKLIFTFSVNHPTQFPATLRRESAFFNTHFPPAGPLAPPGPRFLVFN